MRDPYQGAPPTPSAADGLGMAAATFRQLVPLLAEDGIDPARPETYGADIEVLEAALLRAVERHNMLLFTPVGAARDLAVEALREVIHSSFPVGDDSAAADVVCRLVPESPDDSQATTAGCIGVAVDLLDGWLSGRDEHAPRGLATRIPVPRGLGAPRQLCTDLLALAAKGRAFSSLDALITRYGSTDLVVGAAAMLVASLATWAAVTDAPFDDVVRDAVR